VSGLNLDNLYQSKNETFNTIPSWNLDMTIFSSFHELQLLDLHWSSASLESFDGTHACASWTTCFSALGVKALVAIRNS
jgi:hypothetical protein